MLSESAVPFDRRQRRRQETIEEVLDVAVEIMAEQGVTGLSVGEIARRMGIRPPSLYGYFDSKHALYDALFERGARSVLEAMEALETPQAGDTRDLEEILLESGRGFVRWSMEHRAYSQLLFWRPVPGFTPSAEAYEPAVRLVELSQRRFAELQRRGVLRADVPVEVVHRDWSVLISGVVSQQLSNAPNERFEEGRFAAALPDLVHMFASHYMPSSEPTSPEGSHRGDKD